MKILQIIREYNHHHLPKKETKEPITYVLIIYLITLYPRPRVTYIFTYDLNV